MARIAAVKLGLVGATAPVLALVALVALAPERREIVRETTIAAPPAAVHALLEDLRRWGAWSPWHGSADGSRSFAGAERGVDARAAWTSALGPSELVITASDPDRGLWYDVHGRADRGHQGVFQYAAVAGGTRVVWSSAFRPSGVRERLAGYALEYQLGPELEAGLADLKRAVEARP